VTRAPRALLRLDALARAHERVGLSLVGEGEQDGFRMVKGNMQSMGCSENSRFDVVLCNAVLEHDPMFWKSLEEIGRVTKVGGIEILGVPGFRFYRWERFKRFLRRLPLPRFLVANALFNTFFTSTVTFQVHNAPGDFYRFSEQAVREVFFRGANQVRVCLVLVPPRLIGIGRKSAAMANGPVF